MYGYMYFVNAETSKIDRKLNLNCYEAFKDVINFFVIIITLYILREHTELFLEQIQYVLGQTGQVHLNKYVMFRVGVNNFPFSG